MRARSVVAVAVVVWASLAVRSSRAAPGADGRPNILLIMSDDQRFDTMSYMPHTKASVFDAGISFSRCYSTTALCNPSRESVLTGQYAHNHRSLNNWTRPLPQSTVVEWLHNAGYFTGLVGKYLNTSDGMPRPEFDYWVSHFDGGVDYYSPRLNVNGEWIRPVGYVTTIERDYVLDFLSRAAQQDKPFFLIYTPNAPHFPAEPARGDEWLYFFQPPFRPPNFNETDVSDKPLWIQRRGKLGSLGRWFSDHTRLKMLQTLHSLDLAVDSVVSDLGSRGWLDNTFVMYLSDNGYFWGEHRLLTKDRVYEEAHRIPCAVRYPPLVAVPRQEDGLTANIDLAPTFCDLARVPIPATVNGRSLLPLLSETGSWREDLLLEGFSQPTYAAIESGQYVYVENTGDQSELYDLLSDPYQLTSQQDNALYSTLIDQLRVRLQQLKAE